MRPRLKLSLVFIAAVSCSAFGACVPVTGDRILGRDLAQADPQFSALPATLTVGYTPVPGTPRIFAVAELTRIAKANGVLIVNPTEACFEIPMRTPEQGAVVNAMRRSLPAGTELAIVELPKADVPVGEFDFPVNDLEPAAPSSEGVQLWRGYVRYTSTRRSPVWARVSVSQRLSAVVAARDLAPNVPIVAAALRVEVRTGPVVRERVAVRMEDVMGRILNRPLKAGSLIPLSALSQAPAVRRGDSVKVEVRSGPARIFLDAVAEKEARDGEMVELRNPVSGRIFRARLDGSRAVVVVGAGQPL